MAITIKTPAEIQGMRIAGQLASEVLDILTPHVRAGVTTLEIDRIAHEHMVKVQGGVPATLGYQPPGYPPYPASLCTSLNDVVCHGIPDERPLKNGDIINIDVTVIKDGFHGDTSRMFYVGEPSVLARRLVEVTYAAMKLGIEMVRPGAYLGDIGRAIQKHVEGNRFSVVREYCGHGIGEKFHEDPQVLHYFDASRGRGEELKPGMTFTIEPMVNAGRRDVRVLNDGWTVVTADGKLSAHFEHTVLITDGAPEILTCRERMP